MWEPATSQNLRVLKSPPCTRSIFRQSMDGSEYLTADVNIFEEKQHMLRKLKRSVPSSTRSRPCKRPARSRVDCCRGASIPPRNLQPPSSHRLFEGRTHHCQSMQSLYRLMVEVIHFRVGLSILLGGRAQAAFLAAQVLLQFPEFVRCMTTMVFCPGA